MLNTLWDWGDVVVYRHRRFKIDRLDVTLVSYGVFIAIWALIYYDWQHAITYVLSYIMIIMIFAWMI